MRVPACSPLSFQQVEALSSGRIVLRDTRGLVVLALAASASDAVRAHSVDTPGPWWSSWTLTPFIVLATACVLWLYARGAGKAGRWQRTGFLAGSGLLFLALQSPLDALAGDSFGLHQLQHLVIHALAPMLIALSAPAAALMAGMPGWMRRGFYAPIAGNHGARAAFGLLSTPAGAAFAFIATQLVWLLPAAQTQALAVAWVHDAMHFSMLLAGMFLYFCAFDPRTPPAGAAFGSRVFALLAALLVNIPLGAYLSYKESVLYPAYDEGGRLGLDPLVDERIGGLIQYVPGSMMFVVAVLLVLGAWRRHELRLEGWRHRGIARREFNDAICHQDTRRLRNMRLGLTLGGVCAFMFAAAIVAGILAHRS